MSVGVLDGEERLPAVFRDLRRSNLGDMLLHGRGRVLREQRIRDRVAAARRRRELLLDFRRRAEDVGVLLDQRLETAVRADLRLLDSS